MSGLRGTVLDIGAGSGVNLGYLPRDTEYVALEPNVHFHQHVEREARRQGIAASVLSGVAEALPLDDESVDAVITTLVLCSVENQEVALAEIRRVLRPGGVFVFVEHVAARQGTVLRGLQRALRIPWGIMADGCRPDRDTADAIHSAGFAEVSMESFAVPAGLARPHIAGMAIK